MSEKYSRLFFLPQNLYAQGAPVVIAAGALAKENETGRLLVQLKLQSIAAGIITAATVRIQPLDAVGAPLDGTTEKDYTGLAVARDIAFGQRIAVLLRNPATLAFSAQVTRVTFADGSVWADADAQWKPLAVQHKLSEKIRDPELVKQYQIMFGQGSVFVPSKERDLWRCACGHINHADEPACAACGVLLQDLRSVDFKAMQAAKDARLAEEAKRAAPTAAVVTDTRPAEAPKIATQPAAPAAEAKPAEAPKIAPQPAAPAAEAKPAEAPKPVPQPAAPAAEAKPAEAPKIAPQPAAPAAEAKPAEAPKIASQPAAPAAEAKPAEAPKPVEKPKRAKKTVAPADPAQARRNALRTLIVTIVLTLGLIGAAFGYSRYSAKVTAYRTAIEQAQAGNSEQAIETIALLGEYKDGSKKLRQLRLTLAETLMDRHAYESAIEIYESFGDDAEAVARTQKARYQYAVYAKNHGSYQLATDLFQAMGDYEDAKKQLTEIEALVFEQKIKNMLEHANSRFDDYDAIRSQFLKVQKEIKNYKGERTEYVRRMSRQLKAAMPYYGLWDVISGDRNLAFDTYRAANRKSIDRVGVYLNYDDGLQEIRLDLFPIIAGDTTAYATGGRFIESNVREIEPFENLSSAGKNGYTYFMTKISRNDRVSIRAYEGSKIEKHLIIEKTGS